MPAWLYLAIGLIIGIGVIAGAFWLAFARIPDPRRSDEEQPNPHVETLAQNLSQLGDHSSGDVVH